jgi:hypothetical protein
MLRHTPESTSCHRATLRRILLPLLLPLLLLLLLHGSA